MPKSKSKKKSGSSSASTTLKFGGRYPAAKRRRANLIMAAAGVVAIVAIGAYWMRSASTSQDFAALVAEGQPALARVESEFSRGQTHLDPGQSTTYDSDFPLSGPHHRVPTPPGFYEERQLPIRLVHSIEHGHVVIYYDQPGDEALEELKRWAGFYTGQWDGVVATYMPGMGRKVVLTAWTKRLTLNRFEAGAAAAFIDAFRGRGPENAVR